MHLYLMRHGIAVERDEWDGPDEARPLTSEGRRKTRAVLKALKKAHGLDVGLILTSPLTRAQETARVAESVLDARILICEPLGQGARLADLAPEVKDRGGGPRLLLVGHEPDLGYLASELLGEKEPRPFKKAGVACLRGTFARGGMTLVWQKTPGELFENG